METEAEPNIIEIHQALLAAAEKGRADVIQNLFQTYPTYHTDIITAHIEDNLLHTTPLWIAVQNEKIDAIRVLLACNATVASHIHEKKGAMTPYTFAKRKQWLKVCQVFHEFIIQQIAMDDVSRVLELIEIGISACTKDGSPLNNSLLHWAASCGSEKTLGVLLTKASEVNVLNTAGATPLHEAIINKKWDCVALLIKYRADCTIKNKRGESPKDLMPADKLDLLKTPVEVPQALVTTAAVTDKSELQRQLEEKCTLVAELQQTLQEVMMDNTLARVQEHDSPDLIALIQNLKKDKAELEKEYQKAVEYIEYQQEQLRQMQAELDRFREPVVKKESFVVENEEADESSILLSIWNFFFEEYEEVEEAVDDDEDEKAVIVV